MKVYIVTWIHCDEDDTSCVPFNEVYVTLEAAKQSAQLSFQSLWDDSDATPELAWSKESPHIAIFEDGTFSHTYEITDCLVVGV